MNEQSLKQRIADGETLVGTRVFEFFVSSEAQIVNRLMPQSPARPWPRQDRNQDRSQ